MNRRVQLGLILPMLLVLCLAALPLTAPRAQIESAVGAQLTPELGSVPVVQAGEARTGSSTLLAELDMPFFSFAGITRARL
jgi:hypothetical protein